MLSFHDLWDWSRVLLAAMRSLLRLRKIHQGLPVNCYSLGYFRKRKDETIDIPKGTLDGIEDAVASGHDILLTNDMGIKRAMTQYAGLTWRNDNKRWVSLYHFC